MIPNVTRGTGMRGVVSYLVGAGKRNEHTDPHLVAGDPALLAWYDDHELSGADAVGIARHVDRPRHAFGVEVPGGHVWHCSLSVRADEGVLGDEKWAQVAQGFIDRMGFDDADGVKASTRWVAVHHGPSANGNDHIHVAVNLVREDGTRANIHNDFKRAQTACRQLEAEFGLDRLDAPRAGRATFKRAELEIAARDAAQAQFQARRAAGVESRDWSVLPASERQALARQAFAAVEPPRVRLARMVRGCAAAAGDEAEFVRRARRAGLLVRPRFAAGRRDVVTGYSVAERPRASGGKPWFVPGGQLAHDLSLPRLRERWADTPGGASAAAAEWDAAHRNRRPVARGAETSMPVAADWVDVAKQIQALREQLRAVPADDLQTWQRVASETAGAFAAWSAQVEDQPGALAATADALARTADRRRMRGPERPVPGSAAGAALLLAAVARGGASPMSQAILLQELAKLALAIRDANAAAGDARRALTLQRAVREELTGFAEQFPEPPPLAAGKQPDLVAVGAAPSPGTADQQPPLGRAGEAARVAGKASKTPPTAAPLPTPLAPQRRRAVAGQGRQRDEDRHR